VTLGLRRGAVDLVPYSSDWPRAFADEATRLQNALTGWPCSIEHIGSTAVPGLAAKPILDIAVGMHAPIELDALQRALATLGYEYRGDAGDDGGHVFVRESQPGTRTHHLHLVSQDSSQWQAYLGLRNWLRSNAQACSAYEAAKRALAAEHQDSRRAYTAAKAAIIARLLADAHLV
jgi:GrpB-like predicted nucleotidyltransferase (UPF0157 family)